MILAVGFSPEVACCSCCSRLAFIWVYVGTDRRGRVCVLGLLGMAFILTGRCGFSESSLCAYRNDETFTDSFANYTNTVLPGVILLPQLNLNIFLSPF